MNESDFSLSQSEDGQADEDTRAKVKKLDLKRGSDRDNEPIDPVKTFDSVGSFSFKNNIGKSNQQKDGNEDLDNTLNGTIVSVSEKLETEEEVKDMNAEEEAVQQLKDKELLESVAKEFDL